MLSEDVLRGSPIDSECCALPGSERPECLSLKVNHLREVKDQGCHSSSIPAGRSCAYVVSLELDSFQAHIPLYIFSSLSKAQLNSQPRASPTIVFDPYDAVDLREADPHLH